MRGSWLTGWVCALGLLDEEDSDQTDDASARVGPFSADGQGYVLAGRGVTYHMPRRNSDSSSLLREGETFKFHSRGMGRVRSITSVIILLIAIPRMAAPRSMHLPLTLRSHCDAMGIHGTMSRGTWASAVPTTIAPVPIKACLNQR